MLKILLLSLALLAGPAAAQEMLTEEKALDLACEHNPVIMASAAREDQARQQIAQAEAAGLPKLGAALIGQFSKDAAVYGVYGPGGKIGEAYAGYKNAYQAALTLNWLLYSGGSVSQTVKARELTLSSVLAQSVRTAQAVENGVRNAYFGLQRARAKLSVAQEALSLAKEHLSQVESFYRYGVVAKDQVLRVQVDVSDGKLNVIKAENAVDLGWSALERAVGVSLRKTCSLAEPELSAPDITLPDDPGSVAEEQRPELRALEFSRLSALSLAKAASGARGPQVALQGRLFNTDDSFFPDGRDDWSVNLMASWTFFDGGASRAKEEEARAAARELACSIEDLKKQISMEVSQGKLNLASAVQRIQVAVDQVASAEEDYRMALKRYTANVGTNIDVLDARVALSNAKTQLVDALYDAHTARSDLEYAMGISDRFALHR